MWSVMSRKSFRHAQKGAALTRQLLTFARKVPIEFINVHLNNIIKNVVEIIKQTMDRRIEIVLDMQEKPAVVSGDGASWKTSS